ncbi:hypothetical protein Leryth_005377 [Lithospermum erythrorhizon]|nr:hypothetical protein Leryth_005377 [Lithospermum erythrorhizon]
MIRSLTKVVIILPGTMTHKQEASGNPLSTKIEKRGSERGVQFDLYNLAKVATIMILNLRRHQ